MVFCTLASHSYDWEYHPAALQQFFSHACLNTRTKWIIIMSGPFGGPTREQGRLWGYNGYARSYSFSNMSTSRGQTITIPYPTCCCHSIEWCRPSTQDFSKGKLVTHSKSWSTSSHYITVFIAWFALISRLPVSIDHTVRPSLYMILVIRITNPGNWNRLKECPFIQCM